MASVQTERMPQVGFSLDQPFNHSVGPLEVCFDFLANISTGLHSI